MTLVPEVVIDKSSTEYKHFRLMIRSPNQIKTKPHPKRLKQNCVKGYVELLGNRNYNILMVLLNVMRTTI